MNQGRKLGFPKGEAKPWQVWTVALIALLIWVAFSQLSIQLDSDDALRLAQVRDLLAGQGWFDPTQARLGLEGGTAMHWSRLVDAPIAGMILAIEPFAGRATAEATAMVLWPGFLFAGTLLGLAMICHRLGGSRAGLYGAVIAAVLLAQSGSFVPGSLDHHNLQIMLLTIALAGFIYRRMKQEYAALSGVAVALALGVGIETLPQLATVCLAFALIWAWRGDEERSALLGFTVALSIALVSVFYALSPEDADLGGFCDSLSRDLLLPTMIGAVGLTLIPVQFSNSTRSIRFAVIAGLIVAVIGTAFALSPACFGNPLATIDPVLKQQWLGLNPEAASTESTSKDHLGFFAGGVIGLMIALWFVLRDLRWEAWALLAASIAVSLAMAGDQSRGFAVLAALSILPTAALAARLSAPEAKPDRAWSSLVMLCAVILSVPAVTSALVSGGMSIIPRSEAAPAPSVEASCTSAKDMTALAALPTGLVSAPSSLGAYILLHTPHRALSAPHHRNQAGMLAQIAIEKATPEKAQELLAMHNVDYVVRCDGEAGSEPLTIYRTGS